MSTQATDSPKKASSSNLTRQLSLYSLAAATASVSMLALAQPAQSEVVVTKKTIAIPVDEGVRISLANNGNDDFTFSLIYGLKFYSRSSRTSSSFYRSLRIGDGVDGRGVVGVVEKLFKFSGKDHPFASALVRGAKVGDSANFATSGGAGGDCIEASGSAVVGTLAGKWGRKQKNQRYLGVRFLIDGETHYGWVRLTVITPQDGPMSATITGYAYETVANKPIFAGTEGRPTAEAHVPKNIQNQAGPSLGMLAFGSEGLALWRRDEALIH